jgi:hypothetical protein
MTTPPFPRLQADELIALARGADTSGPCADCGALHNSPGWESMPSGFDRGALVQVGTIRDQTAEDEPTLQEYHPRGTHGWSPDAPIALAYHPCNRCDVWQCARCRRAYLRYTEHGGYYQDERVRLVDPALVVVGAPAPE